MTGCRDGPESVNADAGLNSSASIAPPARAATDRLERIDFDILPPLCRHAHGYAIGTERRLNRTALSFAPLTCGGHGQAAARRHHACCSTWTSARFTARAVA